MTEQQKAEPTNVFPPTTRRRATTEDTIVWPLSYKLKHVQQKSASLTVVPKRWWSHALYRGPDDKPVTILYSRNKAESEAIAKQFLHEPVVGFDMEWPWDSHKRHRLQEKIGLIQVACEDKIGLFHIGLHPGRTTDDLIAPSLRRIIESSDIAKTGVAILSSDMARLARFFKLKPQGALELSHLHRLVTFGGRKPELINTKLVSLATLVEEHLGLPLSKGSVRTSNWSKALNQKQKDYAASDAYAGFMLFHCMNAKRALMTPMPPLPLLAEKYLPFSMPKIVSVQLQPAKAGGKILTAEEFFTVNRKINGTLGAIEHGIDSNETTTASDEKTRGRRRAERERLDPMSQALFDLLSQRRKAFAAEQNLVPYRVASNGVLEGLAKQRPLDNAALLQVKGIGPRQQEKYGNEWLQVIQSFLTSSDNHAGSAMKASTNHGITKQPTTAPSLQPPTQCPAVRRNRRTVENTHDDSPPSSPAFGTPPRRAPQLHTGLSFTLAETRLDPRKRTSLLGGYPFPSSDDSVVFVAQRAAPLRKRKRSESPAGARTPPRRTTEQAEPLTPRSKIFRSKMEAYSKRIASMLQPRPIHPLVSTSVLDQIVKRPPRTKEELHQIPGITKLAEACARLNKDLLGNIAKFSAARY
jgi:ribonuclease D